MGYNLGAKSRMFQLSRLDKYLFWVSGRGSAKAPNVIQTEENSTHKFLTIKT